MAFEQDFRNGLLESAPLASAIEDSPSPYVGRLYHMQLPPGATLPAVVYQPIGAARRYSHGGEIGVRPMAVMVKAWAATPEGAQALGQLVIEAIHGLQLAGEEIGANFIDNQFPDLETESDPVIHCFVIMARCWHR